MAMNKKLLFVTTRLFWPTNSGKKITLFHNCKGLHERYGYDIYLYSFLEADQEYRKETLPDFIKDVRIACDISPVEKLSNLLFKSFLFDSWPLQCSVFYSKQNCEEIRKYYEEIQPDVMICDMIRTAPYIKAFSDKKCMKILDLDDLLSKRYRKQISSAFKDANVAGQYSGKLPSFVNSLISSSKIRNAVLNMEANRVEKAEIKYAEHYDSAIFLSQTETDYYNHVTGSNKGVTITMGVDYDYYSEEIEVEKKPNTLSFVGNFNYAANTDTLKMIATKVLPLLNKEVVLKVIGRCPEKIRQEYSGRKDIFFTGEVDDLRPYVKSTAVFLSPIAYGTGIKTKIMEAMAMGMPVVTNSVGAEGINAVNGEHFLVSDNYAELARLTEELLLNCEQRASLGSKAKELVGSEYTWDIIWDSFRKIGL